MKVKRVAPGWYEVHTGHGVYTVRNCPADNPRATGLPAGPRWMVTYPGEATADAEYPTKRAAVANIATLHDEHERKADAERQNRTRLASMPARQKADPDTVAEIHAERCSDCKGAGCPACGYKGRPRVRYVVNQLGHNYFAVRDLGAAVDVATCSRREVADAKAAALNAAR